MADQVQEAFASSMAGISSGIRLSSTPTKTEINEEINRLEDFGMTRIEAGRQLATYFFTSEDYGDRETRIVKAVLQE